MGTNECSQPASKSSRDSQDFADISMVLKMAHFRKSTGPRWFKKALQFQRNLNKSSTVLIEENALKTSLAQWCQHFRTEWVGKYVQQLQTTAQTKVYPTPTCWFCGPCIDIHFFILSLQWRQNGRDSVSNHQPHDCLLNRLFRRRSKKTLKLHVTGLCAGNSPGTGEFPAQMASNAETVSNWWRHHIFSTTYISEVIYHVHCKAPLATA